MTTYLIDKYWKPRSLTWLVSLASLLTGLTIATQPLHGLSAAVDTLNGLWGHPEPSMLIQAGLIGVGIRGAMK